ncbi:MAG: glycoside hydrolase family 3 protein [Cyclobacteriaceae bacterium]
MKSIKLIPFLVLLCLASTLSLAQVDSLDIKIGQMILIGVPGTDVDPLALKEITEGKAGSIILFEKNISQKDSYASLKKMTWTYQSAAPIPLFISIDEEGGKVNRLKSKYGFPKSISAKAMSRSMDSVRYYSETTATTLSALGINVNFAPVVDLGTNPNNPVIARVERSFSASADTVTLFAKEFVKAHRKVGVVTVLKHFPGHGSSKDDTHYGIADVTNTWESKELNPYKSLLDSGYVDAIMTAHIVNRKLDGASLPGTLSKRILDSLLRKRMGFDGVVFSDDMQMHAITKHFGLEEAIRLSVNAGVDILTFSNNIQGSEERTVDKVHSIMRKFVEEGIIPRSRIDESFERIMKLKRRMGMSQADYYRSEWRKTQLELTQYELQNAALDSLLQLEKAKKAVMEPAEESSKRKKKKKG